MAQSPEIRYPVLQLGIALAVSGTVGAFAVEAAVDPMTIVFWRCAFGAAFLGLWSLAFGYLPDRDLKRQNVLRSGVAGAFLGVCWMLFFYGLKLTSIGPATIVFQIFPFLLVLASVLWTGEKVTLDQVLWMVIAFAGVPLASGALGISLHEGALWYLGVLCTLAAAAAFVVTTMIVRTIHGQRPEVSMFFQACVGAVLVAPLANFHQDISFYSWGWLAGIGVIHTGIVMVAMFATYPRLPTPVIGVMNFIYPAVAVLLDWVVYHHPLSLVQMSGIALIVVATLGVNLKWRIFGAARQQA